MKKVYLVLLNGEYRTADDFMLEYEMNNPNWRCFNTLTEARKYMVELKNKLKKEYATELALEKKHGNTMSVDIEEYQVDDDLEEAHYLEDIWVFEHGLVDSRYLCGRY